MMEELNDAFELRWLTFGDLKRALAEIGDPAPTAEEAELIAGEVLLRMQRRPGESAAEVA